MMEMRTNVKRYLVYYYPTSGAPRRLEKVFYNKREVKNYIRGCEEVYEVITKKPKQ